MNRVGTGRANEFEVAIVRLLLPQIRGVKAEARDFKTNELGLCNKRKENRNEKKTGTRKIALRRAYQTATQREPSPLREQGNREQS